MKTWISAYNPNTWKIYNILSRESEDKVIINKTNNSSERHNRSFQEEFKNSGHPIIIQLVEVQKVSKQHLDALEDMKKRRRKPTKHMLVVIPTIPQTYLIFESETSTEVNNGSKYKNKK